MTANLRKRDIQQTPGRNAGAFVSLDFLQGLTARATSTPDRHTTNRSNALPGAAGTGDVRHG
jgi:hypothetical protein